MLGCNTGSEAVRPTESYIARLDTTGHVVCFGGRVDDLINGLHGEIEGHELALGIVVSSSSFSIARELETYHGVESRQCRTHGQTGKSRFCDGTVDDSLLAEAIQETLCNLVAI